MLCAYAIFAAWRMHFMLAQSLPHDCRYLPLLVPCAIIAAPRALRGAHDA